MDTKYVELNAVLKIKFLAGTGGQSKNIIKKGLVKVNDSVETRNKRKLFSGDVVEYNNKKYTVKKEICLKTDYKIKK